jgi:glutamine cyclotransferase
MDIHKVSAFVVIAAISPMLEDDVVLGEETAVVVSEVQATPQVYGYEVVNTYPHDADAFTQGILFDGNKLYESTGIKGRSTLREVDLETGKIVRSYSIPSKYFGEGIAITGSKIVQLTWNSRKGFVYDKRTFELKDTFEYPTEGWGLTYNGRNLIMSDGSSKLYFLSPDNYEIVGELEVYDESGPVKRLNELEFVKGEILANVWGTERIARIDPKTGRVTGWIEMSGLLSEEDRRNKRVDVLNGIAYREDSDRLFVTGKLWPKIFEVKLVPKKPKPKESGQTE